MPPVTIEIITSPIKIQTIAKSRPGMVMGLRSPYLNENIITLSLHQARLDGLKLRLLLSRSFQKFYLPDGCHGDKCPPKSLWGTFGEGFWKMFRVFPSFLRTVKKFRY